MLAYSNKALIVFWEICFLIYALLVLRGEFKGNVNLVKKFKSGMEPRVACRVLFWMEEVLEEPRASVQRVLKHLPCEVTIC